MQIIPVLDLKGGQVVRAAGGQRGDYRPIITPLSASAEPIEVACGLRGLYPFNTFYVADLDAIDGGTTNSFLLEGIPETWLDAGFSDEHAVRAALKKPGCHAVIGTESQIDTALLQHFHGNPRIILSLDFFADGYRGPQTILGQPQLWPDRIIVMTLAKVGSAAGPDMERLRSVRDLAGDRKVYAAGGIRDEGDLQMLMELGVAGALIASALHDGLLSPDVIERYSSPPG